MALIPKPKIGYIYIYEKEPNYKMLITGCDRRGYLYEMIKISGKGGWTGRLYSLTHWNECWKLKSKQTIQQLTVVI